MNTRNGKNEDYSIQSINNDNHERFEYSLNEIELVYNDEEVNGRFKLEPTQNIYNFILLDQIDERVWQVQWSFKANERFVIPIE